MRIPGAALLACSLLTSVLPAAEAEPPKPASHTTREIQGWTVRLDDRLLAGEHADLGTRAVGLLEGQLRNIALVLPADKLKPLRRVPIWLDLTHGALQPEQYHPSAEWLAKHGYSRQLAQCVHIPDARYFASARHQRTQPWAMLHEFAHAYHDRVLGFDHAEIKAAWEKLTAGGRYKSVLHIDGKPRPHYALVNPQEFFAEMTEAYFGQNDFYPFNSAELKRDEPELFQLLEKLWGPLP